MCKSNVFSVWLKIKLAFTTYVKPGVCDLVSYHVPINIILLDTVDFTNC